MSSSAAPSVIEESFELATSPASRRNGEPLSACIVAEACGRVLTGWCQGDIAQDEDGDAVDALSSDARRWSTLGALLASWGGGAIDDLRSALAAVHASIEQAPLEVWNDRPGRTHDDVVAAFERAITSLTAGPQRRAAAL
jgi:hypothetical protein